MSERTNADLSLDRSGPAFVVTAVGEKKGRLLSPSAVPPSARMKVVPPTTSLHLVQPVMVGDPALQNGN